MAGYIGSKASVTQVDGYNRTEADNEFVNDLGIDVHLNTSTATDDQVLSWDGSDYAWTSVVKPNDSPTFSGLTSAVSTTGDNNFRATSTGGGQYRIYPDDATTANPTWLHQSNSSEEQAWVIGGVERMRLDAAGNLTATSFSGDGSSLTGLPAGYTNSDVDTHLNYSTATSGQVLSYNGSDYDWATPSSGQSTSHQSVGSYAAFSCTQDNIGIGSTVSGSKLRRKNDEGDGFGPIAGTSSTSTASGTWRVMGNHRTLVSSSQNGSVYYANLFVRIS